MKISIKIILLTFINTMFLNNLITSNILIYLFPKNAYLISLLLGLLCSLFFLFLPSTSYQSEVLNNLFQKLLLIFYLSISTLLLLLILFKILSLNFFLLTPTFLIITLFMFFIMLTGKVNIKIIVNMMIIIYLILMFSSQIHIINTNNRDFRLLLPLSFNLKKSYLSLVCICYFLDNLLFLIIPKITNQNVSKYNYVIGTIIGTIISSWFIIDNYAFVNYHYFLDELFPSLLRFKFYTGPKYIEHLHVFLGIYIISYVFIKVLFNLEIFRTLIKKKNTLNYRFITSSIITTILILLFYYLDFSYKLMITTSIILSILILLFYFSLWRTKKHE